MWGFTHTALLNRVESKSCRPINSSPLNDWFQPLSLRQNVASLSVFYRFFNAYCTIDVANCMPPILFGPSAQDFLLLTPIISNFLVQELISTPDHSFLSLVNSGTP